MFLKLQERFYFPINGENLRYPLSKTGRLGREVIYIADFSYKTKDGREVVEDTKGFMTDASKLKLGLMNAVNRIEVVIL